MILHPNGYRTPSAEIHLVSGDQKTVDQSIECQSGYELSGTVVADVTVEARHKTTGGSWTDIETTPLDLSTWAGTTQTFEIRFTVGTITAADIRIFDLTVGPA